MFTSPRWTFQAGGRTRLIAAAFERLCLRVKILLGFMPSGTTAIKQQLDDYFSPEIWVLHNRVFPEHCICDVRSFGRRPEMHINKPLQCCTSIFARRKTHCTETYRTCVAVVFRINWLRMTAAQVYAGVCCQRHANTSLSSKLPGTAFIVELLSFSDSHTGTAAAALIEPRTATPWNILVVDDDPEVHTVTRLVLKGFEYEGRPLRIISAHDSIEAKRFLIEEADLGLILLDVVMERDMAGLDLVRYIRDDLQNHDIRIVLRTGQPGVAPEDGVIRTYDINDYKSKTELTATKLNTLLYAALRSYRDICLLNSHRRNFASSSADIFVGERSGSALSSPFPAIARSR